MAVGIPDQEGLWNAKWHSWGGQKPNPFATDFYNRFVNPTDGELSLYDLGSGDGPDAVWFARQGLNVTAVDFSTVALEKLRQRAVDSALQDRIVTVRASIDRLELPIGVADIVFSHLGLQFFDNKTTDRIVTEGIRSWLRPRGLAAVKLKSTRDPMYGKGMEVDDGVFVLDGQLRHFFDRERVEQLLAGFGLLHLEETFGPYPGYDFDQGFVEAVAMKDAEQKNEWVNTDGAKRLVDQNAGNPKFQVIDMRTPDEFASGHIKGAMNIDFRDDAFEDNLRLLDRSKTYLIYCRTHNRVGDARLTMESLGFKVVYAVEWGITGWKTKGYDMET